MQYSLSWFHRQSSIYSENTLFPLKLVLFLQFSDENYRLFQIETFLATEGLFRTFNHCN